LGPGTNLKGAALFALFAKGARGDRPIPHPPLTLNPELETFDPHLVRAVSRFNSFAAAFLNSAEIRAAGSDPGLKAPFIEPSFSRA